jgi:hypothetical protein
MHMNNNKTPQSHSRVVEDIWLFYFNDYLYRAGKISEQERNRMVSMIVSRKDSAGTHRSGSAKDTNK